MKFSILGFNQEKVLQLRREETQNNKVKVVAIDVVDLLILREIADFMNRKKIIKYIVDDKTFCYVKYAILIEDLPILNIKQQALVDRLNKLCSFGLLEKHVIKNQTGSFPAFRIGDAYESIVYSDDNSHMYQTTSANVSNYKCDIYIDNNNTNNNNSSTINNKEEDTNVSPKKNDYKAIIDCWNECNGKRLGKVTKVTQRRKDAIKKALLDNDITQEQLMQFFKTLPFADSWLYNPNKQHKNWKPDFDWWIANTNSWLTKGLEGKVHLENPQAYSSIICGEDAPYTPACEGSLSWNDYYKCYLYVGFWDGKFMPDGYSDENRPDGASVMLHNGRGRIQWDAKSKEWRKII